MPPIARVTSSPFANLNNNIAGLDNSYLERARLEGSMISGITGVPPAPGLGSFAANAIQQGMHKTFIQFWVEEIKELLKRLKSFSPLALGAGS